MCKGVKSIKWWIYWTFLNYWQNPLSDLCVIISSLTLKSFAVLSLQANDFIWLLPESFYTILWTVNCQYIFRCLIAQSFLLWLTGSDMYKCSKGSNSWRVIDFWVIRIAQLMIPQIRTYLLLAKMINVVNPMQSFENRAHLGFFARNPLAALWSLTLRDD